MLKGAIRPCWVSIGHKQIMGWASGHVRFGLGSRRIHNDQCSSASRRFCCRSPLLRSAKFGSPARKIPRSIQEDTRDVLCGTQPARQVKPDGAQHSARINQASAAGTPAVNPPSTASIAPVIMPASGEHRKWMVLAISSGSHMRPSGEAPVGL